ncbi:hypothetical protein HerbRD11066_38650 [Herbidospora sp. RD11066]
MNVAPASWPAFRKTGNQSRRSAPAPSKENTTNWGGRCPGRSAGEDGVAEGAGDGVKETGILGVATTDPQPVEAQSAAIITLRSTLS